MLMVCVWCIGLSDVLMRVYVQGALSPVDGLCVVCRSVGRAYVCVCARSFIPC